MSGLIPDIALAALGEVALLPTSLIAQETLQYLWFCHRVVLKDFLHLRHTFINLGTNIRPFLSGYFLPIIVKAIFLFCFKLIGSRNELLYIAEQF